MRALHPSAMFALACLVGALAFQLWITPSNPPGFHHDEAAFALNGWTLGHHLRDQDGALLPVIFPSYGDYKSALFSYVYAPVADVFGASDAGARTTAAVLVILAIALIALLAYRRAGPAVAVAAAVIAALCPWLFQLGRIAYDTAIFPLTVALLLVTVEAWDRARGGVRREVGVGLSLALVTYSFAGGRLFGPLLAGALLVFPALRRVSWRSLLTAWGSYVVLAIPFIAYALRHRHGLTARYGQTKFIQPGMSPFEIVWRFLWNYLRDLNPVHWVISGDVKPYIDVTNTAELLAAMAVIAAIGIGETLRRGRGDPFWLFALLGLLLCPVPAALTIDRDHALRLSALPIFVAAFCIPGLQLLARLRPPVRLTAAAVLAAALLGQWAYFVHVYSSRGTETRLTVFETGVPPLVERGFAGGRTIYVDYDDPYGRTVAGWYAVTHRISLSRVVRLPDGGAPPRGSMQFGRTQPCDYTCVQLAEADSFWLARAEPTG